MKRCCILIVVGLVSYIFMQSEKAKKSVKSEVNIKQEFNTKVCINNECESISASSCEEAKSQAKAKGLDIQCTSDFTVKTNEKFEVESKSKMVVNSSELDMEKEDKIDSIIKELDKKKLKIDDLKDLFDKFDEKIDEKFSEVKIDIKQKSGGDLKQEYKESIVQDIKNEFKKAFEKLDDMDSNSDSKNVSVIKKIDSMDEKKLKDALKDLNSQLDNKSANLEAIKRSIDQLNSALDKVKK